MRLHRFIADADLSQNPFYILDRNLSDQIRKVLRLKIGDEVIISDGKLNEARVEISGWSDESISFKVLERFQNTAEPSKEIILYCSVLKRDNFELVVQKCTELGVGKIVPIVTRRTVKQNIRIDRLEKIAREASEQSGRGVVPEIHDIIKFEDAVVGAKNETNLFFDIIGESVSNLKLKTIPIRKSESRILDKVGKNLKLNCWVGPEGGWDESEIKLARDAGFKIVKLSDLTLRAETAAIVATYVAIS